MNTLKFKNRLITSERILSLRKLIMGIIITMFLQSVSISQKSSTTPGIFYSITKPGIKDTSYLFGTYHLINDGYIKDFINVQNAFNNSEAIVVETIIEPSDIQKIQSMGVLKDKLLTDLLNKSFADSLDHELKSMVGIGLDVLNQLKPINVMLTLSVSYLMKNNTHLKQYTGIPLDGYFAENAKTAGKTVTMLEKVDEQMNLLFNHDTDEEQAVQLKTFLRNKDEMISLGDELLAAWFLNDMEKIYEVYEKMSDVGNEMDYLLKERNDRWMEKLPDLISTRSQFIAVGALHLGGQDGLIHQLRNKGFIITPVNL
ncbi:MAG: TraB/GumN family protein [Saprospiraceae bacterium]|nr:TraB/GumN family protein [Saprospiraceae bacterium]